MMKREDKIPYKKWLMITRIIHFFIFIVFAISVLFGKNDTLLFIACILVITNLILSGRYLRCPDCDRVIIDRILDTKEFCPHCGAKL